jgi:hypothetical protein
MASSDRPPYGILEDTRSAGKRRIVGRGAPAGVIPVRVQDGARYEYVHIPGVSTASVDDFFYNSRLQMADLGQDKLVLFLHGGGDFVIELRSTPPATWVAADTLVDSLDHNLVYLGHQGGDVLQLIAGGIAVTWVGWRFRQGRRRAWVAAVLTGALFTLLLTLYTWLRQGQITINSKPIAFSWLAMPGFFLLVVSGTLVYLTARNWPGKVVGLLLATAFQWCTALVTAALLFAAGLLMSQRLGSALWNYQIVFPNLIAFLFLMPLSLIWFEALCRRRAYSRASRLSLV